MYTELQTRLLSGLKEGLKLHEVLQQAGMPSKAVIDRWRLNPSFESDYNLAVLSGKGKRNKVAKRKEPKPVRETVSRGRLRRYNPDLETGPTRGPITEFGTPGDLVRIANTQRLSKAIGDLHTYVMRGVTGKYCLAVHALDPNAPTLPPPRPILIEPTSSPMDASQIKLQERVLELLGKGISSRIIIRDVRGFNPMKLAEWRKDPVFAAKWDKAKAQGKGIVVEERQLEVGPVCEVAPEPVKEGAQEQKVEATPVIPLYQPASTEQVPLYMVVSLGGEPPLQCDSLEKAAIIATERVKESGKRVYILKPVMEMIPEVAVVSVRSRQIA